MQLAKKLRVLRVVLLCCVSHQQWCITLGVLPLGIGAYLQQRLTVLCVATLSGGEQEGLFEAVERLCER